MSILINLAAEFTGKKAFDQADRSIKNMEKSTKQLAKALGYTLSAAAITAYGKAAVKAFTEDEAATIRLTNAVNNLGYAYASADITNFIKGLETSAGIADDKLRPAFQALLTTTKDLNSSYALLNDAIAISRGSGVDLATVAQDLANGYVGVTRGLRKYNTGLTQAELKAKSFSEILGVLNKQFAGANAAYLDSYAYKLDVLTVASNNAKETIGAGLIDAFARLGGGTEVKDAVKAIDNIAQAINGITMAVATVVGGLVKLYKALDFITSFGGLTGSNPKWAAKDAEKTTKAAQTTAKVQAKNSVALTKATKANTAELKKQATLKKAGALFDLDQIQIIAALKGKLSDEDRKRVELQLALLTENTTEAQKLTYEIAKAQGLGEQMARNLASLPAAKNPFEAWAAYLDMIAAKAKTIASGGGSAGVPVIPTTNGQGQDFSGFALPTTTPGSAGSAAQFGADTPWAKAAAQSIYVQIDGKTIATALQDQSLTSGNQAYINRRTGGFE